MGAYVSLPSWVRGIQQRYHLEIGQCVDCGSRSFPPTGACQSCASHAGYTRTIPQGTGAVKSVTVVRAAPPPEFAGLLEQIGSIGVVIVTLDEGIDVPGMLTDCDPTTVQIGQRVAMVHRRIYSEEGIVRYGFKFRPIS